MCQELILSALNETIYLIFTITLSGGYYYFHFLEEKTEETERLSKLITVT